MDQTVQTGAEIAVDFTLAASDPDGDALAFRIVQAPQQGDLGGAPAFRYVPRPGFVGSDSARVEVSDGKMAVTIVVSFDIAPPVLATQTGTELRLNMGPFAADTKLPPASIDETFKVTGTLGTVIVTARGYTQTFGGVGRIVADGGDGNDRIELQETGLPAATLLGGDGNDTLLGSEQADIIDGGAGDDTIDGRRGNDRLRGNAGSDSIRGDSGDDRFEFRPGELGGDSLVSGGVSRDVRVIIGTDAADDIQLAAAEPQTPGMQLAFRVEERDATGTVIATGLLELPPPLENDLEALRIDGFGGSDRLVVGADIFYGWLIVGGDGNDFIQGGSGQDELFGLANDDTIDGGAGTDVLYGGAGTDTLSGGAGDDLLYQDDNSSPQFD